LPTAAFLTLEQAPCPIWTNGWPAIVKPACQDSSVGIDQESVVTNQAELESRVQRVLDRYGAPILIEQFIFGREFHVNFIEEPGDSPLEPRLTMVPLAEIRFEYQPDQKFWPIYSFDAKWDTNSEEYKRTPLDSDVKLDSTVLAKIERIGREAFRLLGLRDYGRLDIRLSPEGVPFILEGNPNPYLMSIALIDGIERMNRKHSQFVVDMIWNTLARAGKHDLIQENSRTLIGEKC
jgi:D-alanine-D-alanine ligase